MLSILITARDKISEPISALFPSNLTTTGISTPTSSIAAKTPSAIRSHLTIPPKIFTKTTFTSGSSKIILNAFETLSCGIDSNRFSPDQLLVHCISYPYWQNLTKVKVLHTLP